MPLPLVENVSLRVQGWQVFRSRGRDHMIPLTGAGRALQRVQMRDVLPVTGVGEGIASSEEARAAASQARVTAEARVSGAQDQPLGVMQYVHFTVSNFNPGLVLGEPVDSEHVVGIVPYDGWLKEVFLDGSLSGATLPSVAIRSSSGGSMFRSFEDGLFANTSTLVEPDFARLNYAVANDRRVILRGGRVPVFAGDQIIVVVRDVNATGAGVLFVDGYIGIEAVVLARPGSAAALSQYFALRAEAVAASRESSDVTDRLRIEQERTRRAALEAEGRLKIAQLRLEGEKLEAQSLANRFNRVLTAPQAAGPLASRQPVLPEPAFGAPSKVAAGGGKGQTFVPAWNPAGGSAGYYIPDPPPGGRVNVFDGKYTVWDVSGRMVSQGNVTSVPVGADIAPDTRISQSRGFSGPSGLAQTPQQLQTNLTAPPGWG